MLHTVINSRWIRVLGEQHEQCWLAPQVCLHGGATAKFSHGPVSRGSQSLPFPSIQSDSHREGLGMPLLSTSPTPRRSQEHTSCVCMCVYVVGGGHMSIIHQTRLCRLHRLATTNPVGTCPEVSMEMPRQRTQRIHFSWNRFLSIIQRPAIHVLLRYYSLRGSA